MTDTEFMEFARKAAHRAIGYNGRIGHLICTQMSRSGEPILREPELRTALQQQAEDFGLDYSIEMPTWCSYSFSGAGKRRALVDFALLGTDSEKVVPHILVELKEGQPHGIGSLESEEDYPKIKKDLHKLFAEPVLFGRCMFHICQAANTGTILSLKHKYTVTTASARKEAEKTIEHHPHVVRDGAREPWFLLLFLVLHQRGQKTGPCLYRGNWNGREWDIQQDAHFP